MNTPIERLRQRHVAAGFPDNQCCVVLSCGLTWPCDTIAALDALEEERNKYAMNLGFAEDEIAELRYRLDIATELIRQAMRARHAIISVGSGDRACGAPPSATSIDTCEDCRPYREWLGGEGQ